MLSSEIGRSHLLLTGGRSGVGKTSAAMALHELLRSRIVPHAVVEGDYLDLAEPTPHEEFPDSRLAERNLAAIWANYRALGYRRLILTNTVSVLERSNLAAAMADDPLVTAVLLRASDDVSDARLAHREHQPAPASRLAASARMAARLEENAPDDVHRLDTDNLTPHDVAVLIARIVGWVPAPPD